MAKVTIVEFSDFQCPHCGAAHPELQRLLREFDGSVRLVYKYFPLSSHTRAVPAARAAEAARAQGKFWEMHDLLFEHQRELEDADLQKYAAQLGLDVERFERDLEFEMPLPERVDADRQLGEKLGIEATPSFFVDGRPFRESPRSLAAYVKERGLVCCGRIGASWPRRNSEGGPLCSRSHAAMRRQSMLLCALCCGRGLVVHVPAPSRSTQARRCRRSG